MDQQLYNEVSIQFTSLAFGGIYMPENWFHHLFIYLSFHLLGEPRLIPELTNGASVTPNASCPR